VDIFNIALLEIPSLYLKITPIDVAEVFGIAFFIYQLLLLIRGTRAIQILQGLGVLLVLLWFANMAKFRTISWILNSVIVMIFVAIPIVFQPELRRALGQIGKGGILSLFSSGEEEFSCAVGEIVDACFHMSRKKVGAIIVIEREIGLEEFMETGTTLHSNITSRLLQTIFFPNSPLHDGAVIIKENKIDSAGCYLPLTESLEVDKDLGTRHRAAIGITEHTDSVAIVVSEETGNISICNNGRLKYDLSLKSLERHMRTLCNPNRKVEKFISFPFDLKKSFQLPSSFRKKKVVPSRDSGILDLTIAKRIPSSDKTKSGETKKLDIPDEDILESPYKVSMLSDKVPPMSSLQENKAEITTSDKENDLEDDEKKSKDVIREDISEGRANVVNI